MFVSSLINAKVTLIAGMAIGAGLAMISKGMCKKMSQLAHKDTSTQHETTD